MSSPIRFNPLRGVFRPGTVAVVVAASALLAACNGHDHHDDDGATAAAPFKTLDGKAPLVLGHRGLPGLVPEETKASYEAAADAGADALEEDLHLSKDCVLVARHNPWLSDNTDVEEVAKTNASVAARKRTVPGRLVDVTYDAAVFGGPSQYLVDLTDPSDQKSVLKSLVVDGEDHTGDWSITDFTAAELTSLIHGTTYDDAAERPTALNGVNPVMTWQQIIDLARAEGMAKGRTFLLYPESKNPYWNDQQAIANGCDAAGTGHPFEDAILKSLDDNGLNAADAPIFVQSFDPASLQYLRTAGLKARAVQLIDGNSQDYKTGAMTYIEDDAYTFVDGRPYSWTLAGDPRTFGDLLTPAGLAQVKTYADGIGPWKPQVMAWLIAPFPANNADGTPFKGTLADVNKIQDTGLIADAHAAGLFVHTYTFRDETKYLAGVYQGDAKAEFLQFFRAGIDGVFTDFATTGEAAKADYLEELGR